MNPKPVVNPDAEPKPKPAPKPAPVQKSEPRRPGEPRPFRFRVFVYRTVVGIFVVEALFLAMAFSSCRKAFELRLKDTSDPVLITDHCPALGDRSETLFTAALATALGLLSANTDPAG